MPNFDSRLEALFFDNITSFLQRKELAHLYHLVPHPVLADYTRFPDAVNLKPDFLILKGTYPYVIIEVVARRSYDRNYRGDFPFNKFELMLELTGADYFVITDLEKTILLDSREKTRVDLAYLEDLLDRVLVQPFRQLDSLRRNIQREIGLVIEEFLEEIESLPGQEKSRSPLRDLLVNGTLSEEIAYNDEGRFFHFSTNPQLGLDDFENQFFQALLLKVIDTAVCRYTTMESVYQTVANNSYRIASHLSMNDRGELDYVDKYIGVFYKPLQSLTLAEMKQLNNSYISSCTVATKEDNLTMYRLYGDDSRGVCIRLSFTDSLQSRQLLVRKISYARSRAKHPELDLIKAIINRLSTALRVSFRFLYLDIWKHFFKSVDYAVEEEVRLLYLDTSGATPVKKDWIIAQPDKIISKYVLFPLTPGNFPLQLQKITLGPNCPEKSMNKRQLEVLIDEKGTTGVTVEISSIESYRKT
jgi:hypothetical protein